MDWFLYMIEISIMKEIDVIRGWWSLFFSVLVFLSSKSVARRCSLKTLSRKIQQKSQENVSARIHVLNKLQAALLQLY